MGRTDAVVEKVEDPVRPIDCGKSTPDPGPFAVTVVGDGGIVVLQPRVQDQPGVGEEVRVEVPEDDGHGSELRWKHEVGQDGKLQDGGGGGQCDFERNLGVEHGRVGAEVIGDASVEGLSLVVDLSGGCESHEVQGPSDGQVAPDLEPGKGTVSHRFVEDGVEGFALVVRSESVFGGGGRDVGFAIREVVCSSVVLGVGVLPGKVGNQEELVDDESNNVVPGLAGAEGTVSALVCNDPRTSHDGSHPECVKGPAGGPPSNG